MSPKKNINKIQIYKLLAFHNKEKAEKSIEALICPMLEYTPVVWSLCKKNQIRLQRSTTKMIQILIVIHIVQRNILTRLGLPLQEEG